MINKDIIKSYVREHSGELAIFGVMVAVSAIVTFAATGDISQVAEAARHRNR